MLCLLDVGGLGGWAGWVGGWAGGLVGELYVVFPGLPDQLKYNGRNCDVLFDFAGSRRSFPDAPTGPGLLTQSGRAAPDPCIL